MPLSGGLGKTMRAVEELCFVSLFHFVCLWSCGQSGTPHALGKRSSQQGSSPGSLPHIFIFCSTVTSLLRFLFR